MTTVNQASSAGSQGCDQNIPLSVAAGGAADKRADGSTKFRSGPGERSCASPKPSGRRPDPYESSSGTACLLPQGRLSALLAVPTHRGRRAPEGVGVSVSESMQDESALASLDLAGLESLRSICSSTALTELLADFRVRRPTAVSSAWRTRWCFG